MSDERPDPHEGREETDGPDPADPFTRLRLDPDGAPIFAAIHGRKGTGKSEFLKMYARSWPYDAIIVDPTRDLDPNSSFTRPWPGGDHWPEPDEKRDAEIGHRRFRIAPDRSDPKHREKVDRVIQLAHEHPEPVFIGIDEGRYLFASDDRVEPGSDVVQNEGRHGQDFLFVANPRAVGIRPVFHHQADWLVIFDLPNEDDLKRVAGPAGIRWEELQELVRGLEREPIGARGEVVTGFILVDVPGRWIGRYPILPLR